MQQLADHRFAKDCGDDAVEPTAERMQQDEYAAAPQEVLPQEKRKVGPPIGAKQSLGSCREHPFQRPEQDCQEQKTQTGAEEGKPRCHEQKEAMGKNDCLRPGFE